MARATRQFRTQRSADSSPESQLLERRWASSEVRRIARSGRPALFQKQFKPDEELGITPAIIRTRTAREMDLIRRLAHLEMGRRLGCLKVVDGDPATGVLITEEVPGRPLQDYVLNEYRRRVDRPCQQAMFLAGRWLRHFQSLPLSACETFESTPDDSDDLVEYCDIRLKAIRELGYAWATDSIRRRVTTTLERLVERASVKELQQVWSHGDYSPGNIIWDGQTLTPIDFAMSRPRFPLTDVTYFIHRLEMLAVYFPWRRWPVEAWRRAVLRGYGRADAERSPMYRALMIRHLCCRLKTYVRRRPTQLKERLHNKWVRGCVRRRLLDLVRNSDSSRTAEGAQRE